MSLPSLTLRPATLADLALIDDIHCRSRRATYRGHVSDHHLDEATPATSLADWQAKLPQALAAGGCGLVAESDGVVYVHNLHALPERKGRGVGPPRGWRPLAREQHEWDAEPAEALLYEFALT